LAKKKAKKKSETPEERGWFAFLFVGGPKKGQRIRLAWPPKPYIRLGIPEWSTYEYDEIDNCYVYLGTEPPPKEEEVIEERIFEHAPVDPTVAEFAAKMKASAAWERGRKAASEAEGTA